MFVDFWRVYKAGDTRKIVGVASNGVIVSGRYNHDAKPEKFIVIQEEIDVLLARLEEGGYEWLENTPAEAYTASAPAPEKEPVGHWLMKWDQPDEAGWDVFVRAVKKFAVLRGANHDQDEGILFESYAPAPNKTGLPTLQTRLTLGDGITDNDISLNLKGAGPLLEQDEELFTILAAVNVLEPFNGSLIRIANPKGQVVELGNDYQTIKDAAEKLGFDLKRFRHYAEMFELVSPLIDLSKINVKEQPDCYF